MFIIELQANDMHAALGRLLDQTRVHNLRISAVSARMMADGCRIMASLDIGDRGPVDKVARRLETMVFVLSVDVRSSANWLKPDIAN
ncbi:hypothetical protein [Bradyrhizobium centrosematis]|uniref:hypothetical protein n=1 Tax=Bradyrhizobium centrosematis TaxID=1300039 RepID=UPI00388F3F4D